MNHADQAKALLPGFDNGANEDFVHMESRFINDQRTVEAAERGDNVIVQMLGEDPVSVAKRVAMFEDRGYEVHLHCTELNKNKSLGRALGRFYRTGRYHDWNHLIQSDPVAIANTYELLKGDESIAGYSKWNTDVPFGEHPIALEYSDESESNLFGGNLQRDASGLRTQAWDAGNGNAAAVGADLGIGRDGLNTESTEGTVNEDGAFSDDVKYSLPQDAPYMAAVERGEMDQAQQMVSDAWTYANQVANNGINSEAKKDSWVAAAEQSAPRTWG